MDPIIAVEDWLLHKALGRAVVVIAQGAASFMLAHAGVMQSAGISASVDPNVLAGIIMGGLHVAGSWLAMRYPKMCGWLGGL